MIILIVKQNYNCNITIHSENPHKHLRWSFILEIAIGWNLLAISSKKLPLRCLAGIQVRKTGDDKGTSRLS